MEISRRNVLRLSVAGGGATALGGLIASGVDLAPAVAHQVGSLPPVSSLFAAVLGVNPVAHLLSSTHVLATLPPANQAVLTGPAAAAVGARRVG